MDQQTLHSLRERAGVARQALEKSGVAPGIAHGDRFSVPIEVHPKSLPQTTVHHGPAYRKWGSHHQDEKARGCHMGRSWNGAWKLTLHVSSRIIRAGLRSGCTFSG